MIFGTTKLNTQELGEVRALNGLIKAERYKLHLVQGKTDAFPGAKKWIEQQSGVISLLEEKRQALISQAAIRLGLTGVVELDISSGKIWTKTQ